MKDNIRIYYNNQCVFITQNANALINNQGLKNAWILRNRREKELINYFMQFIASDFENLILEGAPLELLAEFEENFELIQAGGGVVWNEKNELLMINRLGKWDLPKGKLDPGEELAICAVREVEEETGLKDISLSRIIKSTYHIYFQKEQWILKQTEWYEMLAPKQNLVPQIEEDIAEAVWVSKGEVVNKLKNSYSNILYLLEGIV